MHRTHGKLDTKRGSAGILAVIDLVQRHGAPVANTTTAAAFPHHLGCMKMLPTGHTLLHCLCSHGRALYVSLVLLRGASPEPVNDLGRTPMMNACLLSSAAGVACVRTLLAHGARVDRHDCLGMTALTMAAAARSEATVRLLLDWCATYLNESERLKFVNARAQMGYSALSQAARNGDLGIVKILFAGGAHLTVSYNGESVIELATKFGHTHVADWLLLKRVASGESRRHAQLLHREVVPGERDEYGLVEPPVVPTG